MELKISENLEKDFRLSLIAHETCEEVSARRLLREGGVSKNVKFAKRDKKAGVGIYKKMTITLVFERD